MVRLSINLSVNLPKGGRYNQNLKPCHGFSLNQTVINVTKHFIPFNKTKILYLPYHTDLHITA